MSFFIAGADLVLKNNQLMKVHALIDWSRIAYFLKKVHKRDESFAGGPIPYDPLQMVKALLLAHWHNLSDTALIESLSIRIDFMRFTGFDLGDE